MDKKYIENQYHLAVLDFQTARSEEAQWEARKTMARLEQIAAQEYGFEYADDLHERELGGGKGMKVGAFQIGRYHAIIKKSYADGSADYETSFSDEADLMESVYCIKLCVGKMVGLATDTPKVLDDVQVIRGKENIVRELEEKQP